MPRLINVSNRLPVKIGDSIQRSSGGLVAALDGIDKEVDFRWVGWSGGVVDDKKRQQELKQQLNDEFGFLPIFLTKRQVQQFYSGFSNSSLWPLLHYMLTYSRYDDRWWRGYYEVNQQFADAVLEIAEDGDLVWVHDYHLMLLPRMLRKRNPSLRIGFFLHTPFPSSELFRGHPNRTELLRGMLGADLIGFHTFGYLRHFRSTVLRLLGQDSEMHRIIQEGHATRIGVYPIGIGSEKFLNEMDSDEYHSKLFEYRQSYHGKQIVLSVERLDYTKGIPRRLDAIHRYLSEHPDREDVVFIFVSVPSRDDVQEYKSLRATIERKVSQINGKFSTIRNVPVHFINKSVNFSDLCALYTLADVCTVTPLIDGMNLVAKEYIACQQDKPGVLLLSEFAGAAQELFNAVIVNPYDINQVAKAISTALSMSEDDRRDLLEPMKRRVLTHDSKYWARSFVQDLNTDPSPDERLIDTRDLVIEAMEPFFSAEKVAFFLDYDGTLREIVTNPSDAGPTRDIDALLHHLEASPIDTYIISGRKKDDMQRWLGHYDLTLIAEHGFYYRLGQNDDWQFLDTNLDLSWKNRVHDILNHYAMLTPGSNVEEKTSSLVWHYRRSDPEFGAWKANQLVAELYEMLSNLPVEIRHGRKIVEVSSTDVNKGKAVEHFYREHHYEAVLCAGDDQTDEAMFRATVPGLLAIKIGHGDTQATFKVPGPKAFRNFLNKAIDTLIERHDSQQ